MYILMNHFSSVVCPLRIHRPDESAGLYWRFKLPLHAVVCNPEARWVKQTKTYPRYFTELAPDIIEGGSGPCGRGR